VKQSGRYEFHGTGKDLYKAVVEAQKTMPKGFVDVSAQDFIHDPGKYGLGGEWVESEVES
jgi:hypothetical protein